MTNQLLDIARVANFNVNFQNLTAGNFSEVFTTLVPEVKVEFELACKQKSHTYESLLSSPKSDHLVQVLGIFNTLTSLARTDELDELEETLVSNIYAMFGEFGRDTRWYDHLVNFTKTLEFITLSDERKYHITETIEGMTQAGVGLDNRSKRKLTSISKQLSILSSKFGTNLTVSCANTRVPFAPLIELSGVPQRVLKNMERDSAGNYIATYYNGLDDILQYASKSSTRKKAYNATRKHGMYKGLDNRKLMQKITELRHEYAQILDGNKDAVYSQISLRKKMAKTPERVFDFLTTLKAQVEPSAKAFAEYQEREGAYLLKKPVQFHDRVYVSRLIKEQQYQLDTEKIRSYFEYNTVRDGLFGLVRNLFDVEFVRNSEERNLWDEHVEVYDVMSNNCEIGTLYLDPFARINKQGGAWMSGVVSRDIDINGSVRNLPQAIIVTNISKGAETTTLPFIEVETLFHEMGHALHHLLTKVEVSSLAGINNVEWDAVELPSQMLENFAWNYDTIKTLTSCNPHGEECLPIELFDKMTAARHYGAAGSLYTNIKYALIDMTIYSSLSQNVVETEQSISEQMLLRPSYDRVSLLTPTFSHIFNGGYAAGYYSYLWAEVLSADAYAAFEEGNIAHVADKFKRSVLEVGGTRSMNESFKEFRGRQPDSSFLLKSHGIESCLN